jgi:hypothetical protein
VTDELVRAIRTESAEALKQWFDVGTKAVWRWRLAFLGGAGKFTTPGSKEAHLKASQAGGAAKAAKDRWTPERGGWTAAEVKLLRLTNAEVAAKTGRTVHAVRAKRRRKSQS